MVRLVIGGRNAGKYEYLKNLGYKAEDCAADFGKPVLYKLNDLVKRLLAEQIEPIPYVLQQLATVSNIVIVCDEVGCGVVPLGKAERAYRETVGRVCIEIASQADIVERIYCGIATRIKGQV